MMTRRRLLSVVMAPGQGKTAVALSLPGGQVIRCDNESGANGWLMPPGSAVKPFTLLALPKRDALLCRQRLKINGRRLDCTHVEQVGLVDAETALAASCNNWFAARAAELDAGAFRRWLLRWGGDAELASNTGELQLQALGLALVRFTPLALARAYARLAESGDVTLRRGLERAVSEGTGQWAAGEGFRVAGKTGTTREGGWFAGFAPAERPRVAVAVLVRGGTGGGDAAPAAKEVLEWWRRSEHSR